MAKKKDGIPWRWVFAGSLVGFWTGSYFVNRQWTGAVQAGLLKVGTTPAPASSSVPGISGIGDACDTIAAIVQGLRNRIANFELQIEAILDDIDGRCARGDAVPQSLINRRESLRNALEEADEWLERVLRDQQRQCLRTAVPTTRRQLQLGCVGDCNRCAGCA